MNYKILKSYWYTPTFPGLDPLEHVVAHLPTIAVIFVAIETSEKKWKSYMGWHPVGPEATEEGEKSVEQLIARNGAKVSKEVACAHFPGLDPEGWIS